ncbi:MAG: addiction module antitoxin RelB [Gammaproteobacteria bacterium]|nr:MAG: addiction module antitoxin RelB [Gammaproteobacteria bacterium]
MSTVLKQVIENIEELTSSEKALVARCLISSLEIKHDESVDNAWANLAEERFSELESGVTKGVSWSEIRNDVTGKSA